MELMCRVLGHRRSQRVWSDGLDYRADCRRCGRPMIRDVRHGWRPFDKEQDFDLARSGKPSRS